MNSTNRSPDHCKADVTTDDRRNTCSTSHQWVASATGIHRVSEVVTPLLSAIVVAILTLGNTTPSPAATTVMQQQSANSVTLTDRLVSGLKVRHPEEKEFIAEIVKRVSDKRIPLVLVDSTYFWVRQNSGRFKNPFFYFERVLRQRAKTIHVYIPPFKHPIPGQR